MRRAHRVVRHDFFSAEIVKELFTHFVEHNLRKNEEHFVTESPANHLDYKTCRVSTEAALRLIDRTFCGLIEEKQ